MIAILAAFSLKMKLFNIKLIKNLIVQEDVIFNDDSNDMSADIIPWVEVWFFVARASTLTSFGPCWEFFLNIDRFWSMLANWR